jgi:hypothetical protein
LIEEAQLTSDVVCSDAGAVGCTPMAVVINDAAAAEEDDDKEEEEMTMGTLDTDFKVFLLIYTYIYMLFLSPYHKLSSLCPLLKS